MWDSCVSDEKEYFIGSIICIPQGNRYEVVDGQQRLITLTLIMQQLGKFIEDEEIQDDLKRRICSINPYAENRQLVPTLTVRTTEHDFYLERIIKENSDCKSQTNHERVFLNNQKKIGKYLEGMEQEKLKKLVRYILQNVFVVFVKANDRASSFRLFDVLNNRMMTAWSLFQEKFPLNIYFRKTWEMRILIGAKDLTMPNMRNGCTNSAI